VAEDKGLKVELFALLLFKIKGLTVRLFVFLTSISSALSSWPKHQFFPPGTEFGSVA
jgi:uncharacterized protein YggT (Ycf19 family)